jgi:CRP-like cAMP-binding protein
MAGLMPPVADPPVTEMPEGEPATPEEQAQYDELTGRALLFIYNGEMLPKLVDQMRDDEDPVEALANVGALVLARVNAALVQSGKDFDGGVKLNAAAEVFDNLADIATAARIHDFDTDVKGREAAFLRAMDQLRIAATQSGQMDQQTARADMAVLQAAEQDGSLQRLLASLGQVA